MLCYTVRQRNIVTLKYGVKSTLREVAMAAGENEISKKQLLQQTGISYGQLYRWKRERLIPEEWFVKRSAFTGQETYFPREQVLARVRAILELKDTQSLDELAQLFSPESGSVLSLDELAGFKALDKALLSAVTTGTGPSGRPSVQTAGSARNKDSNQSLGISTVVFLTALSRLIGREGFSQDEAAALARANPGLLKGRQLTATDLTLIRTCGNQAAGTDSPTEGAGVDVQTVGANPQTRVANFHIAITQSGNRPLFDSTVDIVGTVELAKIVELIGNHIADSNKDGKEQQ
jgi:hypothetical protein